MKRSVVGIAAAALLLVLAACNDSGGANDATTTDADDATDAPATTDDAAANEAAAYCDLVLQIETEALAELSSSSSPREVKAATASFLDDNTALLDQIQEAAPDEISDAYAITVTTLEEIARTGDLDLATEPDAAAADQTVQQYQLANC